MAETTGFSEFLTFLSERDCEDDHETSLPTLSGLSDDLEISVSRLREQLEVAKALGFVDVRPRVGIRQLPYRFSPAVRQSLFYAIRQDHKYFEEFLDLRRHVEYAYLPQAMATLTEEDEDTLRNLILGAKKKLDGRPARIPHQEHRNFHLTIFRRLENVFVTGLLEAYWDAYEAVGLDVYADMRYLKEVWRYHEQIAESISAGDVQSAQQFLKEHFDLLIDRLAS